MNDEVPRENPPLSAKEKAAIAKLTKADIAVIDAALLANCFPTWRKVAMVAPRTASDLSERFPDLTYIFYAQRLIYLVEQDRLESQGNLKYMRFSEVRLPAPTVNKKELSRQMKATKKVMR